MIADQCEAIFGLENFSEHSVHVCLLLGKDVPFWSALSGLGVVENCMYTLGTGLSAKFTLPGIPLKVIAKGGELGNITFGSLLPFSE
jgi:hypothetical protein